VQYNPEHLTQKFCHWTIEVHVCSRRIYSRENSCHHIRSQ